MSRHLIERFGFRADRNSVVCPCRRWPLQALRWLALSCVVAVIWTLSAKAAEVAEPSKPPVLARKTIIFGGGNDFPPYEFVDAEGQPAGFDVDIVHAVARVMGLKAEIRITSWDNARKALKNHEVDVLQGMFQMPERESEFAFSIPYWTVGQSIFGRKGAEAVTTLADLDDKRVVVHRGSIMHDHLRLIGKVDDKIYAETPADTLRQLALGNADYAVLPYLPGIHLIKELGLTNVTVMAPSVMSFPYGFAVNRADAATLAELNEGLNIIYQTGELQAIRDKWLGVYERELAPWRLIFKYASYVLVPILLVLGLVMLWSRLLYRQGAGRRWRRARPICSAR